ncbi:MAG: cytochrome b/b6 domain-containing protein [Nitrospirota bacterium]|jgi:formate dehydrogenase gamma subunit
MGCGIAAVLLAALMLPAAGHAQPVAAAVSSCLACHGSLHGRRQLEIVPERYRESVHGALSCFECHSTARVAVIDAVHREHTPRRSGEAWPVTAIPAAKSAFADALSACRRCHATAFKRVVGGVHGRALLHDGNADAPFCVDCHGDIHTLRATSAMGSAVARGNVVKTCGRCHADRIIASRYNLNVSVVQSYQEHFHGKKYALGGKTTPTCADCHGHHAITAVEGPEGLATPAVKVALCGRCHEGVTPEFAAAFTHTLLDTRSNPIAARIRAFLVGLVALTVLLLTLHIVLDVRAEFRAHRRPLQPPHVRAGIPWKVFRQLPSQVERMDLHARIQHGLLLVAVLYLGASGLALKFPDHRLARGWIGLWGGVENAGHLHRFAALLLILVVAYHLIYVVVQRGRGRLAFHMVPRREDLTLFVANLRYLSGQTDRRPRFGKFTYYQKLDYWLVTLVVLAMIVTGLMYWFPTAVARLLPHSVAQWIWGVAYVVHSTEAVFVLFVAFVWHFYNVHLRSRVFPMSWVWLTGKIDIEELLDEHPAAFDALVEAQEREQPPGPKEGE